MYRQPKGMRLRSYLRRFGKNLEKAQSEGDMAEKKTKSRGAEIIEDLTCLRDALRSGQPIGKMFTVRTVELQLQPHPFDAEAVKRTRDALGVSQALFARLLGVSTDTVQSWEQGLREPCSMACRLLELIGSHQEHWLQVIKDSSKNESPARCA